MFSLFLLRIWSVGTNVYPQSMFPSENKKIAENPCKDSFTLYEKRNKGVLIAWT